MLVFDTTYLPKCEKNEQIRINHQNGIRFVWLSISTTIKKQNHEINFVYHSSHPHHRMGYRDFRLCSRWANSHFISNSGNIIDIRLPKKRHYSSLINDDIVKFKSQPAFAGWLLNEQPLIIPVNLQLSLSAH
jgi:hypothetical protein